MIQAASVIAPVGEEYGLPAIVTTSSTPSNWSAPPIVPATQFEGGLMLVRVPVPPLPLASTAVVPLPSSSVQCPTSPEVAKVSTGATLVPVIATVVLPAAVSAPPAPCAPALPSLNVQSITTEAGGVPLALAYAICRIAAFTSACVAFVSNVSTSVPPPFVVTAPIVVPPTVSAAPWVSAPSVPVAEKTSCALGPPLRDSVSVAPA